MSEWIEELKSALAREFAEGPAVATLATVDKSGAPRARSVVCRRISPDGSAVLASDARSEKNEHLKVAPQAELVFWLPTLREQYRLQGLVRISGVTPVDPMRLEIWRGMSDAARALFAWPTPGARKSDNPAAFTAAVPATTEPPANFELITLRPRRVESLQLSLHPHRRRKWTLAGKWGAVSELNP